MLKILLNEEWVPIQNYQSYYIDIDEEGNQSMQFVIPLDDMYYKIKLEGTVQDDFNCWLVKGINQLATSATIICDLDMDAWHTDFYLSSAEIEGLQTKTIVDALNYIKPSEWTIQDKSGSKIKRTLDLEKCTAYDLLMRAKSVFDVQYDIDALNKCITIINPYEIMDTGVYVTPELNMKSTVYKGDSQNIITRLYCYGAEGLTFASINNGKPYIENTAYKGNRVLSASWADERYTNMESLLEDGRKKLKEMSAPTGSYTIDVIDLQTIDERYANLELALRSSIHCIIDPDRSIDVIHRVVKKRIYPDFPSENRITLSNQPRSIEKEWNALKENVETVQKDGYRYETEIRQNNKEIVEVAKKTDENTNNIQSVEEKITPEQLLITVSDSIKSGNKIDTTQVIIDLIGLTIKNGGIKVYDGQDNLVFFVDEKTKKLVFKGDISGGSITGETTINVGTDLYVGNRLIIGDQKENGHINHKSIDFSENAHILGSRDNTGYYQLFLNAMDNVTMSTGAIGGVGAEYAAVSVLGNSARVSASYSISLSAPLIQSNVGLSITSDKRLKDNVHEIDVSWINELHIVGFKYKGNASPNIGLIAQDCLDNTYASYFIDKDDKGYYSIRYENILNALIKYCQRLNARITELEKKR